MRSLWCTLIAVCFVAAGVRPRHAERTRGDASAVHVASASHVSAARRAPVGGLGPVLAPAAAHASAPVNVAIAAALPAPAASASRVALSPRSSRGPPHA